MLRLVEQVWQELSQGINGLEANGRTDVATARHGVVLQAKQKHTQRSLHDVEVKQQRKCCTRSWLRTHVHTQGKRVGGSKLRKL